VLSIAAARLGLQPVESLSGGGSPATVWLARGSSGELAVLKILVSGAGRVDGHDLSSFVRKPRQISRIHRDLPGLSASYVRLRATATGHGWACYATHWCAGVPLARRLADGRRDGRPLIAGILRRLTEDGYASRSEACAQSYFELVHRARYRRRLWLLREHLGSEVIDRAIVVNGRWCVPAGVLLERICRDPALVRALRPGRLHYPVHGDLNLGNVLVDDVSNSDHSRFTVIDPRGISHCWDVVYDLAKMLFSMTAYESAMVSGFRLRSWRSANAVPSFEVGPTPVSPVLAQLAHSFTPLLEALPFARIELERHDPHWRTRLVYVHAMHYLAESACRLSDTSPRQVNGRSGLPARRHLALGLFLLGTLLLNVAFAGGTAIQPQPETVDPCRIW
jgi:Phosphotransferase enzyme family